MTHLILVRLLKFVYVNHNTDRLVSMPEVSWVLVSEPESQDNLTISNGQVFVEINRYVIKKLPYPNISQENYVPETQY